MDKYLKASWEAYEKEGKEIQDELSRIMQESVKAGLTEEEIESKVKQRFMELYSRPLTVPGYTVEPTLIYENKENTNKEGSRNFTGWSF